MNDARDFFLKEKPVKALLAIHNRGETYCSEISEGIDSTYAHTVRIISRMEDLGLLETKKEGRKKMVSLSDEGEAQAKILVQLIKQYGDYSKEGEGKLGNQKAFSK